MAGDFRAFVAGRRGGNPIAEAAIALGVPVFPCTADKRPATEHGFKDASTDSDVIRALFARGGTLIGMPTGEVTGLIVIDVDQKENRQGRAWLDANSHRMPQTRTIRTSSGGLHIYLRWPGQRVKNQKDKIAPGIDVRGDGGYVIVPPSTGYTIADDAPVADVPDWLIATLCPPGPVAVPTPPRARPSGDGTAYGLAALDGECEAIRMAGFGNQEHTINVAGLKIGALVAGGELPAGLALSELISSARSVSSQPGRPAWSQAQLEHKVRRAFQDGQRRPRASTPAEPETHPAAGLLVKMHERATQHIAKPLSVASGLMDAGGALGLFVDYCEATAISPQPFLALAAGICAIGALAGRRYRTRTNLRTNLYAVGIADSGGGKDHARKRIKAVFGAAGLTRYLGGEDIASGVAMMSALQRHPAMLFQIDEFGDWLGGVLGKQAAAHKKQIAERFKTLYSSADSFVSGTEYANQTDRAREDIQQPHACLYGTTTPGQFWSALASGSMHDGLIARMLIFVSPVSYPDERESEFSDPPPALIEAFQAIAAGHQAGNLSDIMQANVVPEPYLVDTDPAAERAIRALRIEQLTMQRRAEGTYVTAIAARWAENAIKLALVRAVSRSPASPLIQPVDVTWGRALAKHCIDTLLQDVERHVADNDYDRRCGKAMEIIRKRGPVSESEMQDRFGWKHNPRERAEVLRDLVSRGRIQELPTEAGKRGRKTVRYVLAPSEDGEIELDQE